MNYLVKYGIIKGDKLEEKDMKFTCRGLELADAVLKVVKASAVRTTNPILECVKLTAEDDNLTLMCSDLELTIIKKIKADVKVEGEAVIPAKFFSEFARKISTEQITFTMRENNVMEVLYGDNTGIIQCQNAEEFPEPKELKEPNQFEIKSNDLRDLVMKASVAVAQDDSRPMLRGILLEVTANELKGVALDGVRMGVVTKPLYNPSLEFGIIVTARSLVEIVKILPENNEKITVFTQRNHLKIDLGDTIFITRLLGQKEDFVSYNQILPSNFTTEMVINRQKLYNAIERASLLNWSERNHIIKLTIKKGNLTINSESEQGNITENIPIEYTGNDLVIDFNGRLIIDSLHVIGDEYIKMQFGGQMNPCLIVPNNENKEYLYLILPMRV